MKWFDVKKCLPKPGQMVIVACRCTQTGACHTGVAWRFKDNAGWNTRQSGVDLAGIEYWTPLPEPPAVMSAAKALTTT